jgi:short-subunit dehydrogenase
MESGKLQDDGVIVLTGAASGIGRAAAESLARKSRRLALVDINAESLEEVARSCRENSAQIAGFACDVTDGASVERTCRQIEERFGAVDVLVNSAGIGFFGPFLETPTDEWQRIFNVNVMGTVHCIRSVLPGMIAAGRGLIVNVGSRMAIDPCAGMTAYAASKAAVLGFTKALVAEVSSHGVKVTYLAPGGTKTNIATPKYDGYMEPAAIADAIVYIIENEGNAWVRNLEVLPLGF